MSLFDLIKNVPSKILKRAGFLEIISPVMNLRDGAIHSEKP